MVRDLSLGPIEVQWCYGRRRRKDNGEDVHQYTTARTACLRDRLDPGEPVWRGFLQGTNHGAGITALAWGE